MRGSTPFSNTALTGTNATLVQAGKCSLAGYHIFNTTAAAAYVQFFDAAAAADVTLNSTVPLFALGIPASEGACRALAKPIQFTKGMVVASTTTPTGATGAATCVELDLSE
jgi:hypothetical protein